MSRRDYPRIGKTENRPNNTQALCPCGSVGKVKIHIEWIYMRGEDDVVWRCWEHRTAINKPEPLRLVGAVIDEKEGMKKVTFKCEGIDPMTTRVSDPTLDTPTPPRDVLEQVVAEIKEAAHLLASFRIFTCSREKAKQPEGTGLFDEQIERLREAAQRLRALPSLAELERDAGRMRWLQRMAAYVGFSADAWLVDPTRIDVAIEDENRPARASEAQRQEVGR